MWFVRMFSLIRIVNLLSRKPPLTRKREASEALECETEIIEGPSVQAVLQSVRRRPTPQSLPDKAVPEGMRGRAPPPPEGRFCNKRRLGLVHQRICQLRSMRWRWKTSNVGRMGSKRILHGLPVKRHLQTEGGLQVYRSRPFTGVNKRGNSNGN